MCTNGACFNCSRDIMRKRSNVVYSSLNRHSNGLSLYLFPCCFFPLQRLVIYLRRDGQSIWGSKRFDELLKIRDCDYITSSCHVNAHISDETNKAADCNVHRMTSFLIANAKLDYISDDTHNTTRLLYFLYLILLYTVYNILYIFLRVSAAYTDVYIELRRKVYTAHTHVTVYGIDRGWTRRDPSLVAPFTASTPRSRCCIDFSLLCLHRYESLLYSLSLSLSPLYPSFLRFQSFPFRWTRFRFLSSVHTHTNLNDLHYTLAVKIFTLHFVKLQMCINFSVCWMNLGAW